MGRSPAEPAPVPKNAGGPPRTLPSGVVGNSPGPQDSPESPAEGRGYPPSDPPVFSHRLGCKPMDAALRARGLKSDRARTRPERKEKTIGPAGLRRARAIVSQLYSVLIGAPFRRAATTAHTHSIITPAEIRKGPEAPPDGTFPDYRMPPKGETHRLRSGPGHHEWRPRVSGKLPPDGPRQLRCPG